jgi:L-Ala-D/L-Glu epimerase
VRMEVRRRTLRLRTPLQTAHGTVREREIFTVALRGRDGVVGHGEAAPLEPYDGVSVTRVGRALERYRAVLEDPAGWGHAQQGRLSPGDSEGAQLLDACRAADELPQALAAIDLALWDMAASRQGCPVSRLLVDAPAEEIPVNATLAATDRAGAAAQAARAVAQGFDCLKVKVGVGDDAARVAAVRAAAGPNATLRLDANGAWGVDQAVAAIDALSSAGLELVEEPSHGLDAIRAVRERVAVRVAIDETAAEPGAMGAAVADAVCLKISRCGGISGLLAAAALVRASGAEVYLASSLDGPLGVAAAVHAASALAARGMVPACGLATLSLFEDLEDQLPASAGTIAVPQAAGLGVRPL